MKRIFMYLCGAAVSLLSSAAPEISWLSVRHNFGAIDEGAGEAHCEFKFVNTGDEPLTVLSARASCGCTTPEYPKDAVAPGDTASVMVSYNPAGRPGRFSKSVYVETTAAGEKRSKLIISGVVIGAAESVSMRYPIDHGALKLQTGAALFGQVAKPHMKTLFVNGYNRSADSLRIKVVSKPKYIDLNFEPKTVGPGEQVSIICYLRSGDANLWGFVEDSVKLSAGGREFWLPFTAIVNEDFSKLSAGDRAKAGVAKVDCESVDFDRVSRNGGALSREVLLSNAGKSTLEVRRVYTVDSGVNAEIDKSSIKKGKSGVIKVTVDPSALPGDILNARVTVMTNDPEHPVITLRVVGEVVE